MSNNQAMNDFLRQRGGVRPAASEPPSVMDREIQTVMEYLRLTRDEALAWLQRPPKAPTPTGHAGSGTGASAPRSKPDMNAWIRSKAGYRG